MADDKHEQASKAGGARPIELSGDGPELIAFALLRYLAQLEQQEDPDRVFNRAWMLDAYAECLDAVRGNRSPRGALTPVPKRARMKA